MSAKFEDLVNAEIPWEVISYPRLPSTMDEAGFLLRRENKEGVVVTTRDQYQGRGRNGKTWIGKPGDSIAFSVTLFPKIDTLFYLTPAFSLALVNCFNVIQDSCVGIKWPNDILIDGKKVAGILVETILQKDLVHMVLGVGINLTLDTNEFKEIRNQATSLKDHTNNHIDVTSFEVMLLTELQRLYILVQNGWSPICEWKKYLTTIGHWVKIRQGSNTREGTMIDVDNTGRLLLQDKCGGITPVSSGELL